MRALNQRRRGRASVCPRQAGGRSRVGLELLEESGHHWTEEGKGASNLESSASGGEGEAQDFVISRVKWSEKLLKYMYNKPGYSLWA